MTRVAVLGTGHMGGAMAKALGRAGFGLVLWNRTAEKVRPLAEELGARLATSAGDAVADVDVAISMVADEAAVEALYRSPGGVLEGLRDGTVVADMSTVPPTVVQGLAPDVASRGAAILDAPVSGSVTLAEAGQLTVMVGGDEAALERARPVFDALAKTVIHIGPLGSGAGMKLAVNTIIFGLNGALAEALVLAERAGIDRERAYDVIAASAVGAPFVGYKRAAFLDPDGAPTAFALELAEKDLRLISGFAEQLGVPMPQTRTNLEVVRAASADAGPDADFAAVAVHLRGAAARTS